MLLKNTQLFEAYYFSYFMNYFYDYKKYQKYTELSYNFYLHGPKTLVEN